MGDRVEVDADDLRAVLSIDYSTGVPRIIEAKKRLRAAIAPPPPTFTDDEALAFYRAMWPDTSYLTNDYAIRRGRRDLTSLLDAGWTAPPPLCPPARIDVDEVARRVVAKGWSYWTPAVTAVVDVLREMNREAKEANGGR